MSIEAMKQALEAMEYADACLKKQLTTKTKHEYAQDLLMDAGVALRQAIGQAEKNQAREPKKWVYVECPLCGEMAVAHTHPNLNKEKNT